MENVDFELKKIKILMTLLRDYGVKHVVLCPGGRDVPLVRGFENNSDTFILHRITDERSAAYFALGIAAETLCPVACVCTSGTAVCNFIPAVTEAFYTGVPLIVITADRYEIYHGQGEDQTIVQTNLFSSAIKKSFTIPEGNDYKAFLLCERGISECLLESIHNSFGPVHINFAISNASAGKNYPIDKWKIEPQQLKRISIMTHNDLSNLSSVINELKFTKKILIICGQNLYLDEKTLQSITKFAEKYNCPILTDHISNLHNNYTLSPYSKIKDISQSDFDAAYAPDILITFGGKRLMNDPITAKIRRSGKNIKHWSINPCGKIVDFYFKLSTVFEMVPYVFFNECIELSAKKNVNDSIYFSTWKKISDFDKIVPQKFNTDYIMYKCFSNLPKNSLLHLGVGQIFIDSRKYFIDPSIKVYCNMGTNGIDGCTSTFLGSSSVINNRLSFLLVGDLSFFYDMNSIWNKKTNKDIRILMINNNGTGLLRGAKLPGIESKHNTSAKGWVTSTNFIYMSAKTKNEFDAKIKDFVSNKSDTALFFEVFCD